MEIKTTTINKEWLEELFATETHQTDIILKMMEKVCTQVGVDWKQVQELNQFFTGGKEMNDYIWDKFVAFDQKHHPTVMNGGAWMNYGFSSMDNEKVGDWDVTMDVDKIIMKS